LDENLYKAQEMEFFFRYLQKSEINYKILNKELLKVRLHDHNITSSFKFGNINAMNSEMKVRLKGLKILREISDREKFNIAINHYFKFLILILKQRKISVYNRYLFSLLPIISISKYFKILKLFLVGLLFKFTNRGLYHSRKIFSFDS
jgi:hypothetical protein